MTERVPDAASEFIGREEHLENILLGGLFWISGMPGVGKSQLAFEAARLFKAQDNKTQALLADLRGFSAEGPPADPSAVLDGLLRLIGVPHHERSVSEEAKAEKLRSILQQRQHLLVLDDAHSVEQVQRILPEPSGLNVVVTSRLHPETAQATADHLVGSHWSFAHIQLDVFTDDESLDLLSSSIGQARIAEEPEAAASLIHAAANLPLAVNLVASRVAVQQGWTLADHVSLVSARQHSLRLNDDVAAAFDASYRTLSPEVQTMFRLLAVHPVALLDHECALALAGGEVEDPESALGTLVRHHLLTMPRPKRYVIHSLLRVHAADVSLDNDPPVWRSQAHARLMANIVTRAWSAYQMITQSQGKHPRQPRSEVDLVKMSQDQATEFFEDCTDLLLLIAHEDSQVAGIAGINQISETMVGGLLRVGRFGEALALHSKALRQAQDLRDREGEVRARVDLGTVLTWAGQFRDAQHHFGAVEPLVREYPEEEVTMLNAYGIVLERSGDNVGAEQRYRRSIELSSELGNWGMAGFAWNNLAGLYDRTGRIAEGRHALEQSVEIGSRVGDPFSLARGLANLASVLISLKEHEEAERRAREALSIFEETDHAAGIVVAQSNLASSLIHRNLYSAALPWCQRALERARQTALRQHEVTQLNNISTCQLHLGDLNAAGEHARAGILLADEIGDPFEQGQSRKMLGDCLDKAGDRPAAVEQWRAALGFFEAAQSPRADPLREHLRLLEEENASSPGAWMSRSP
ncbi:tetratricopeptide repeat protein [Nesterenkonia muleiensis]|uniref:tetratricopeptide repeat protein n=1 Tax=Nesterenkonia muleiensis TaxID=2282648 RepID=UPI001390202C|nr:tetratricopeptide repeat protein [Nesterenkonia muleiensis]